MSRSMVEPYSCLSEYMAHPRTLDDFGWYEWTRKSNRDAYKPQQSQHEDDPMGGLALSMHSTSSKYISDMVVSSDNRFVVTSLPGDENNFSQAPEFSFKAWDHALMSNDIVENTVYLHNHLPLMSPQEISPMAVETGSMVPLTPDSDGFLLMDLTYPTSWMNGCGQREHNGSINVNSFPDISDINAWDEELQPALNELHHFTNAVSWTSPFDNNNSNDVRGREMLNYDTYQQETLQSTSYSHTATLPQICYKPSSMANTASYATERDFQRRPCWHLETRSHAKMSPLPPLSSTQSLNTMLSSNNLTTEERRSVVQDDIQSGLMRPIRTKAVAYQSYNFINKGCNDGIGKKSQKCGKKSSWSIERKRSVAETRKRHACGNCYVNKVKCSEEDICTNCRKFATPYKGTGCHRLHLGDYVHLLLPGFLVGHLKQDIVRRFTSSLQFGEEEQEIQIFTGRKHPPFTLLASRIVTSNNGVLSVPALAFAVNSQARRFVTVETLDYAMRDYNPNQVKQKLRDHIEAISDSENIMGDRRTLRCKLLLIICRFLEAVIPVSKENDILRSMIMMNRIQYVMDRLIVVKEKSALNTESNTSYSLAPSLNRQLKSALKDLQEEITRDVLERLDSQLRRQTRDNWDISFCAFLILCICIEDVQITIDLFVLSKASSENSNRSPDEPKGTNVCTELETKTLDNSWVFINYLMKKVIKECHPFKQSCRMDKRPGRHEAQLRFREDIRQLMTDHGAEISRRSSDHYQGGCSRVQEDHLVFRKRCEGRLVCKALQEFR